MKRNREWRLWLALALSLAGAGCGDMRSDLVVMPDGAGNLTLAEFVTDFPGLAFQHDPDNRNRMADIPGRLRNRHAAVRQRDLKEIVDRMGPSASLGSYKCELTRLEEVEGLYESAIIDFGDINGTTMGAAFFLNLPPGPDAPPEDKNAPRPEAEVTWKDDTLSIGNFWQGDFARATAGDWFDEKRRARAAAALPLLKGRFLRIRARAPASGKIVETNALYPLPDGDGVLLAYVPLDAFLEALLDDGRRAELAAIAGIEDRSEQLRRAESLIPGLKLDGAETIVIKFAGQSPESK